MKTAMLIPLLVLLISGRNVWGQQSQGEWEPFKELKEQKRQEQSGQVLTNDSIVKLVKAGLGEDLIINMVKTQPGKYSVGADDIISLKQAGVSDKIITAMLNESVSGPTPTPVGTGIATEKPGESRQPLAGGSLSESGPNTPVPKEHGLYYQASNRLVPIEGQVISFARTGSRLSSTVTFGIKSAKMNVQLLGKTSAHNTVSKPLFYYRAAEGAEAAGGSAGDLLLVKMSVKHNRRQFEIGAAGAWRASQGISIRSQLQVTRKRMESDLYRLAPAQQLKPGEYGLFLFRGYDLPGFVYDFSVE
jgi:hypothetical protein